MEISKSGNTQIWLKRYIARRFMVLTSVVSVLILSACQTHRTTDTTTAERAIESRLITSESGDLVLLQEVLVEAPVQRVWRAYTTEEGWTAWASPIAEIDLRTGGTLRTHYDADAVIGDAGTNTLHIVNYVPERLLTLRAEVGERWPEVMKEDAGNLMNVIVFDPVDPGRTRILSYGVGYRDTEAYGELMQFFIPANEKLFQALKDYLEK